LRDETSRKSTIARKGEVGYRPVKEQRGNTTHEIAERQRK